MPEKIKSKKQGKNPKRREKLKKDLKQWLFVTVLYIFISALVLGTVSVNIPEPIHLYGIFYVDVGTAISMLILSFYFVITGVIFMK